MDLECYFQSLDWSVPAVPGGTGTPAESKQGGHRAPQKVQAGAELSLQGRVRAGQSETPCFSFGFFTRGFTLATLKI